MVTLWCQVCYTSSKLWHFIMYQYRWRPDIPKGYTKRPERRVGLWSRCGQVDYGGRDGPCPLSPRHEPRAQGDCWLLCRINFQCDFIYLLKHKWFLRLKISPEDGRFDDVCGGVFLLIAWPTCFPFSRPAYVFVRLKRRADGGKLKTSRCGTCSWSLNIFARR